MAADQTVPQSLPRVTEDAVFVPEEDVRGAPNVVVDGARQDGHGARPLALAVERHARRACAPTPAPRS